MICVGYYQKDGCDGWCLCIEITHKINILTNWMLSEITPHFRNYEFSEQ